MRYVRLELALRRVAGDAYSAEARLRVQPAAAETVLTADGEPPVAIDFDLLTALSHDPEAYGRRLAAMLFADERLIHALSDAQKQADTRLLPLRLCLRLPPGDLAAHAVRWETLGDPSGEGRLALRERLLFSRFLDCPDPAPITRRAPGRLSAVAAVAGPTGLEAYGLKPLNAGAELGRVRQALGRIPLTVATHEDGHPAASLPAILAALHDEPDILYLMCHGSEREGESYLWLEDEDGGIARVSGTELAEALAGLQRRPVLTVLMACRTATSEGREGALAAAGPRLARAGLPAVLAMQGAISLTTAEKFMRALFRELQRDGQIDRAVAAARAIVGGRPDWWAPALFTRLDDGCIWEREEAEEREAEEREAAEEHEEAVHDDHRMLTIINEGTVQGSIIGFHEQVTATREVGHDYGNRV